MGHWGTAIFSNDTSADIRDTFLDLFDKGKPISEIRSEIEKEFKEGDDLSVNANFWLTLAALQWQVGDVDKDVRALTEKIIDQDIDLKVWRESEADEKSLIKRKSELIKLRDKLQTTNPKPRKIKKKVFPKSIFKKGEIYAFPLNNKNYSALIIFEEVLNEEYYFVLVANTDINSKELPTLEEVLKSHLITKTPYKSDNYQIRPAITSYTNSKLKDILKTFVKIGEVEIKDDYTKNYLSFGLAAWPFMIEQTNTFFSSNAERPKERFLVKNYVKTKPWYKKFLQN
jgi:HD superfamily phosphohydrolase